MTASLAGYAELHCGMLPGHVSDVSMSRPEHAKGNAMPSKANRKQIVTVVMAESLMHMLSDQGGFEDAHFRGIRDRLTMACDAAYPVMIGDPGGGLRDSDTKHILREIEHFKKEFAEFTGPDATSYCLALVTDQLAQCGNRAKVKAFEKIKDELENLHTYFDPEWSDDGVAGYQAACVFDGLRF
jgi:hypothetical protein